jgi:valyl-tRNA synthetase
MADAIYHFTWGTFCDWYVELVKPLLSPLPQAEGEGLSGENMRSPRPSRWREGSDADETRGVAAWAFDQILVMLHPLMPFVTEELWSAMGTRPYELIVAQWPKPEAQIDPDAKAELEWLIELVQEIRSARTELNVPPGAKLHLFAADAPDRTAERLDRQHGTLSRLARLESIQLSSFTGAGAAQIVVGETTFALPLEGVIDLAAERSRLEKAVAAAEKDCDSLAARLANPSFTERAKPEAVDKARAHHDARAAEAERLRAALARLG